MTTAKGRLDLYYLGSYFNYYCSATRAGSCKGTGREFTVLARRDCPRRRGRNLLINDLFVCRFKVLVSLLLSCSIVIGSSGAIRACLGTFRSYLYFATVAGRESITHPRALYGTSNELNSTINQIDTVGIKSDSYIYFIFILSILRTANLGVEFCIFIIRRLG